MNEKRSHEWKPFAINFRIKDNFGKWGNWHRREPAYFSSEQRDAEFEKLKDRPHVEYIKVTDQAELDGQLRAMERMK